MPIYEYTCAECRRDFEVLLLSAAEEVACENCGSKRVEKRFSVFGVGTSSTDDCAMPACPPQGCDLPQCSQRN